MAIFILLPKIKVELKQSNGRKWDLIRIEGERVYHEWCLSVLHIGRADQEKEIRDGCNLSKDGTVFAFIRKGWVKDVEVDNFISGLRAKIIPGGEQVDG